VFFKRNSTGITPVVPVGNTTGATTRNSAPGRILATTVGLLGFGANNKNLLATQSQIAQ
jgi:hypothetical protein